MLQFDSCPEPVTLGGNMMLGSTVPRCLFLDPDIEQTVIYVYSPVLGGSARRMPSSVCIVHIVHSPVPRHHSSCCMACPHRSLVTGSMVYQSAGGGEGAGSTRSSGQRVCNPSAWAAGNASLHSALHFTLVQINLCNLTGVHDPNQLAPVVSSC